MTIGAAIVLYAVCWFMTLFVVLPLRLTSQEESGEIVPGTPSSAPTDPRLGRKAFWVTIIATVIWAGCVYVIIYEVVPLEWFDFYEDTST